MALLAPQRADADGVVVTPVSASASDTFAPVRHGVLHYRTSGTGTTLTIVIPGNDEHGQARPDISVVMASTAWHAIDVSKFVDDVGASGVITVTSSSQTGLTVAYLVT